ncbi:MAG: DUF1932 domain-containing protein [Acidimicrobiales bacterium]
MTTIGFLHPGQMGVTIAANAGTKTAWAGNGRSPATAERAKSADIQDLGTVAALCEASDIIISICPPAAAIAVADEVVATGFEGTYVDANAVSPATSKEIGAKFASYIDGGVVGPPAIHPGSTRLYLAGPGADELALHWAGSALDVRPISDSASEAKASALKMAYAGWTKGQSALLLAVNALAESAGVADELRAEWDLSQPGTTERSSQMIPALSRKAWRFAGEMEEIAASMADGGVPDGFHLGAAELYYRMAEFKEGPEPSLSEVVEAILQPGQTS